MTEGYPKMQLDVPQEIFEIVKVLPEDKQRIVLRQAESLADATGTQTIWQTFVEGLKECRPKFGIRSRPTVPIIMTITFTERRNNESSFR